MTIDGAILGRLRAITAVTDIVGTGVNARIFAEILPQNPTLEAITFKLISAPRVHAFGQDPGLVPARYQIEAWGETYEEARDLADAIRGDGAGSGLSRWSGTQDSTVVQDILLENEQGVFEDDTEGYQDVTDYMIWYEE